VCKILQMQLFRKCIRYCVQQLLLHVARFEHCVEDVNDNIAPNFI